MQNASLTTPTPTIIPSASHDLSFEPHTTATVNGSAVDRPVGSPSRSPAQCRPPARGGGSRSPTRSTVSRIVRNVVSSPVS